MIVDPKLERMFRQCRERKLALDKRKKRVRAAMFSLPALLTVLCPIHMFLSLFSSFAIFAMDGYQGRYPDVPCFFISAVIAVFAACETILELEAPLAVSNVFYPAAAVACLILNVYATANYRASQIDILGHAILLGQYLMTLSCIASIPLDRLFKRCLAENETLRPLKGYPHFNPMLLTEAELSEEKPADRPAPGALSAADREALDGLSPDERLMRERDMNL